MSPSRILVVNAGSSSLKLRVLGPDDAVDAAADLPAPRGVTDARDLERCDPRPRRGRCRGPPDRARRDGLLGSRPDRRARRRRLEALTDLAPLHQPKSLAALAAVTAVLPGRAGRRLLRHRVPRHDARRRVTYALPPEWRTRWDLRRYGFHGLSHAYASRRAAELLGRTRGRPADRDLPPGRRRVARRRPGRTLRGHHDGLHAPRRTGHGHALRQRRSGARPLARGARRDAPGRAGGHAREPIGAARPRRDGRHAGDPGGRRRG